MQSSRKSASGQTSSPSESAETTICLLQACQDLMDLQVGTLQQPRTGWTLRGATRSSPRMFGRRSQMPLAELWPPKEPGAAVGPLPLRSKSEPCRLP